MSIALSPEKKAFIQREIAAGGFKSESDAVERALDLYEDRLRQLREAVDKADQEIVEGRTKTLGADDHLNRIRVDGPPRS